ncbi:MAG TPA: hypothetical protein VMW72_04495 [Sedimentisphaerales bacterium]|nr:hypothetical protein [Sedimentisphaerales bacterium]
MFKNFVSLLPIAALISAAQITDTLACPATLAEVVTWLEGVSHRLIRASRRTMRDGTAAFPPQVGIGYEAFWLRDFLQQLKTLQIHADTVGYDRILEILIYP